MNERIPKVVSEGKIKVKDLEIRVLVLDNGQRIIPEEDMKKALKFLGLTNEDVDFILRRKEASNE